MQNLRVLKTLINFTGVGGTLLFSPPLRTKDTSLRRQRDADFFAAYVKAIQEHDFVSQSEAINYVRCNQAPKFYIDWNFCSAVIGRMLKGMPTGLKGEQRHRKFEQLYKMFLEERSKPGNENLSQKEICYRIVDMPAPEFYINYRAASGIISEQRRLKQEEMMRWVR